jgi:hypothetical protein
MLTTRFWGSTTVLLYALLLQNCQSTSVRVTEEWGAAAGSSSVSSMRQHTSSKPLTMWSLTPLSSSPVAYVSPSRYSTVSFNKKGGSAAPSSHLLSPTARYIPATIDNSSTAPYDLPAAAMPEVFRAVPLGNKSGHAPSPERLRARASKVERVLREMLSDEEGDSKLPAKRRSSDLDDELTRRNEKVRDGERWERGCIRRDALNILLTIAGSEPDKAIEFLEVLLVAAQDKHCRQQALEALGKVVKASSNMFPQYLPCLRVAAKEGDKDVCLLALRTLGEVEWKHYFGEVEPAPDLPKDMATILDSACPIWPGKKIRDTHLLMLIPTTVDGAPFTLTLLGKLIQHLKNGGHKTKYRYYSSAVKAKFGRKSPDRSYWLLMTRDVLEGSRGRAYSAQSALVARYTDGDGRLYEVPNALEAATAILMHHARTGEWLFGDNPRSYTRCQELVDGKYAVVVGGFESSGLYVFYDSYGYDNGGVAGCWKF